MTRIQLTITVKSPLHIGALAPAGTSSIRGMIKARDGWPYVPASALKGRLRHAVEQIANSMDQNVCDTHRKMCRTQEAACPACRIFGSPWIAGQLRFIDLELSGPEELAQQRSRGERPTSEKRYGIGVSRTRKVAAEGLLYTTELFQPGVEITFSGDLVGALSESDAALTAAGILYLNSLGGSRTRGLGWIEGRADVYDDNGRKVPLSELRLCLEELS